MQIKELLKEPKRCKEILDIIKLHAKEEISKNKALLSKIDSLCDGNAHTVAEIACALRTLDAITRKEEHIGAKKLFRTTLTAFSQVLVFAIAVLPLALSIVLCGLSFVFWGYKYPKLNVTACITLSICLLLCVSVLILLKFGKKACLIIRKALVILCIFAIPINIFASLNIVECSETHKTEDYLSFDFRANQKILAEYSFLFPKKEIIQAFDIDHIDYYYRFKGSGTFCALDIFLECNFSSEEQYNIEVNRVQSLFTEACKETEKSSGIEKYGNYNAYFFPWGLTVPFEEK